MVVGGGAGALAFVLLATTRSGVRVEHVLSLPGLGLVLGMGLFSFRRSLSWGVVAAVAGTVWTVLVLWLNDPTSVHPAVLAASLVLTPWGALHLTAVGLVGVLVGSGWRRARRAPAVDPRETDER